MKEYVLFFIKTNSIVFEIYFLNRTTIFNFRCVGPLFTIYSFLGILKRIVAECKDGASARDLCTFGDKLIIEETGKVYKKEKELKKG